MFIKKKVSLVKTKLGHLTSDSINRLEEGVLLEWVEDIRHVRNIINNVTVLLARKKKWNT